jgi:DNA-binding transcriptional LysR family regulator
VAEALSFTERAKRLNLAQPSVTRQIKDLKGEIGVKLIDRSGKRISLTQEGVFSLAESKNCWLNPHKAFGQCDPCAKGMPDGSGSPMSQTFITPSFPLTIEAFRKVCPRTVLSLFDTTPAEQFKALELGKVDIGFVCFRPPTPERSKNISFHKVYVVDRL